MTGYGKVYGMAINPHELTNHSIVSTMIYIKFITIIIPLFGASNLMLRYFEALCFMDVRG